jgi:hypothetical protein
MLLPLCLYIDTMHENCSDSGTKQRPEWEKTTGHTMLHDDF